MFSYQSNQQLKIEGFETPFEVNLDRNNRWVKLAELLPWDRLAGIYSQALSTGQGAPSIDARIVIGAVIIKHKLKLDDRGTIEMIQENPYMQFFLGLSGFKTSAVFDASLFVTIRKRIGPVMFDEMTDELLKSVQVAESAKALKNPDQPTDNQGSTKDPEPPGQPSDIAPEAQTPPQAPLTHHGVFKADATVCDQYIKYPTDFQLVATARQESERLIDILCKHLNLTIKPRTYRRKARIAYLNIVKCKKLSAAKRRKAIGEQLRYLRRNLEHLDTLLDQVVKIPYSRRDYKIMLVIRTLYEQQYSMWKNRTNRCDDRIVSIYQPHVRPIVRGKAGKQVEFGAKVSIAMHKGFTRIDSINWNAYNESTILIAQVIAYRAFYGHWPALVVCDQIYATQANRRWLKEQGIRLQAKPLGRPPKQIEVSHTKPVTRNDVEGKFGEGKNGFHLNKIRATLKDTSESWIAAIFYVMNINAALRAMTLLLLFFQLAGFLIHSWRAFIQCYTPLPSSRRLQGAF